MEQNIVETEMYGFEFVAAKLQQTRKWICT